MKSLGTVDRIWLASALAFATASTAHATTVSPMVIDLQTTGRGVTANISVHNTGDKPMTMEVKPRALDVTDTGLIPGNGDTDDLLVMPPSALITPGSTLSFRVQWIGDPAATASHHYFVGIDQLPVKLPEGQSAVQIVYNFDVLVNVGPTNGKAALAIKSTRIVDKDGKPAPAITVSNTGTTYGYMSQHKLRLVESDASGKSMFDKTYSGNDFEQLVGYGIVATGQTRTMVLPVELPSRGGTLSATLLDEHAQ
ncbi:MAG TPA: hypothetical protein VKQ27_03435 [Acetobacteraceae bacterium]|nr:hypothetical protein [Acetobacteraceae bacterium]